MRSTYAQYLVQEAANDPTLYLITGDLGFSVFEPFQQRYGHRFINAGIAEQAMIGLAAGLAMTGKRVYIYSIVPFGTMRCYEQIRNNLCYQRLPVTLFCGGGGYSYGAQGTTHHAIEDIAIMRALPEMTVVAPGSKFETAQLAPQVHRLTGPAYVRMASNEELITYASDTIVTLGKAITLVASTRTLLVATGNTLDLAWTVCHALRAQGMDIGLISMPTIKPLDTTPFDNETLEAVFTIEEHSIIGGLGSAIAQHLAQNVARKIMFHAFGINDFYTHEANTRNQLNERAGLSVEAITEKIREKLCMPQF